MKENKRENKIEYRNYYNKNLSTKLKELENNNIIKINKIILDFHNLYDTGICSTLIK